MKLSRRTKYLTPIVLAFGIYGAYRLMAAPAKEQAEITTTEELSPRRKTDHYPEPSVIKNLREELRQLKTEIASLRRQTSSSSTPTLTAAPTPTQEASKQKAEEPSNGAVFDQAAREKAEIKHQQRMEELEQSFYNETRDPDWSATTTSSVQDALKQNEVLREATRNIECHSSTCRIEITDDGSDNVSQSISSFAEKLSSSLPSLIANRIDEGEGTATMVLYLSRESKILPKQ